MMCEKGADKGDSGGLVPECPVVGAVEPGQSRTPPNTPSLVGSGAAVGSAGRERGELTGPQLVETKYTLAPGQ